MNVLRATASVLVVAFCGIFAAPCAGQTVLHFAPNMDAFGIAVDRNDNVVVSGELYRPGGPDGPAVLELTASDGYETPKPLGNQLGTPQGVVIDAQGNIFVADVLNSAVREITAASGYVVVKPIGSGFLYPQAIAIDGDGNLFVADAGNNAVKEILASSGCGEVDTLATELHLLQGIAVDKNGNVFVSREIQGPIIELSKASGYATQSPIGSGFFDPVGLAVDGSGNVFVADAGVAPGAIKEVLAAGGYQTVATLGPAFYLPQGLAIDRSGNIFVTELGFSDIKELPAAGGYSTAVEVGPADQQAASVAIDGDGNLIVADVSNNTVSRLSAASGYTAVDLLCSGFAAPRGVGIDSQGNVFVADSGNGLVKEIPAAGGYGTSVPIGAGFNFPTALVLDASGNVFVGDSGIEEILAAGGYSTVKSLGNTPLGANAGIALDAAGNIFAADGADNTVKEILAAGGYDTVKTIAGGFNQPNGVTRDSAGNLFVTQTNVGAVVELLAAGGYATAQTIVTERFEPPNTAVDSKGNVFVASATGVDEVLAPSSTALSLTASPGPSQLGQSVTFTVTIVSGSGAAPTGTVTFTDGTATLGSASLQSGGAIFATAALVLGDHVIGASYAGDGTFAGSIAQPLTQTVIRATSATSVASSLNPSSAGQTVTFTATVASAEGQPSGSVTFQDGAAVLGTVPLAGGLASFSLSSLAAGSHAISVAYGGDTGFQPSMSPLLTQSVGPALTAATTVLGSSANPSSVGQAVTFTATVSGQGGTPTGSVIFKDGTTTLGIGTLAAGSASVTTGSLALGSHVIAATYGGDGSFDVSVAAPLTQLVNAAAAPSGLYVYQSTLGTTGVPSQDNGHFDTPSAVAYDSVNGHVVIADTANHRVQILDASTLATVATIGVPGVSGTDNAHLDQPGGIVFDAVGGRLFVADTRNERVQIFDAKALTFLGTLGTTGKTGTDNSHFNQPSGLHINPVVQFADPQLYVADAGNARVQIFNLASLDWIGTLGVAGTPGNDAAHLDQPSDAEYDPATNQIIVADSGNARLQVFDASSFLYVSTIGGSGGSSTDDAHFARPTHIAFDAMSGLILVSDDGSNARLQALDGLSLSYVATLGKTGSAGPTNAQFAVPLGAMIDRDHDRLFVADGSNDRVQVFSIAPQQLFASVLPGSRTVQLGAPATVFASVINAGAAALQNCQIALPANAPPGLTLSYQTTNSATNGLIGRPNTPVTIQGNNGLQTFLLSLRDSSTLQVTDMALDFDCAGAAPAAVVPGVDTLDLEMSSTPLPDIIALAATPTNDGIVRVPLGGSAAFAVSASNVGAAGAILISVGTGTANLPMTVSICQTNPNTGACLDAPRPYVGGGFASGAATFSVFVTATGPIPLAPATARVFVKFGNPIDDVLAGVTSVAIETQ